MIGTYGGFAYGQLPYGEGSLTVTPEIILTADEIVKVQKQNFTAEVNHQSYVAEVPKENYTAKA